MWAATLSNGSPLAVYRLSKCALHGGNPWRLLFQDAWHKERSISALSYDMIIGKQPLWNNFRRKT